MKKDVMKICFLAPANNYHTIKWCTWFTNRGHEVFVISFTKGKIPGSNVYWIDTGTDVKASDKKKIKYLFQVNKIKKIISVIEPDIVNVHYASSYGAVAALAGIKNYVLSVWGADIYDFPNKSFFHKKLLEYSLKKAKVIFSTSKTMANETSKYVNKKIYITPFGVDMNIFIPSKRKRNDNKFVIGNIKALEKKYGIEILLQATKMMIDRRPDINLEVRIAGRGSQEQYLKKICKELQIEEIVQWLGFIDQNDVAKEWANMDVAVITSILESESFGVSAVEAQACGTAVIISDISGLMEATIPGRTCGVVSKGNSEDLVNILIEMYENKEVRRNMGIEGRKYVYENYELNQCFEYIENLYINVVKGGCV